MRGSMETLEPTFGERRLVRRKAPLPTTSSSRPEVREQVELPSPRWLAQSPRPEIAVRLALPVLSNRLANRFDAALSGSAEDRDRFIEAALTATKGPRPDELDWLFDETTKEY